MFVLALDCSTARGSLALARDGACGWRTEFVTGRGQGGRLFAALREAMAWVGEHGGSLETIIVGLGPGSYSGVRQAVAAAIGLAAATGAGLAGVVSAAALAVDEARYQAVGDARRGTFYYTAVENGVCTAGPELLEDQAALRSRLAEHAGWPAFAVEALPAGWSTEVAWPLAERLLALPRKAHLPPPLEPIYLRPVAFTLPKP